MSDKVKMVKFEGEELDWLLNMIDNNMKDVTQELVKLLKDQIPQTGTIVRKELGSKIHNAAMVRTKLWDARFELNEEALAEESEE